MKRSEINGFIEKAKSFAKQMNVSLPPYAFWSAGDWQSKGLECNEIRNVMLGWDVTDFEISKPA